MNRFNNSQEDAARIAAEYARDENAKFKTYKFKMFFTSLIFAILSFIGTHPIQTTATFLKVCAKQFRWYHYYFLEFSY